MNTVVKPELATGERREAILSFVADWLARVVVPLVEEKPSKTRKRKRKLVA